MMKPTYGLPAPVVLAGEAYRQYMNSRSQVRHGSRTDTKIIKKRKTASKHSFKKQMMDATPAKHVTSVPNTAMTHNTLYTCCPTQAITQGDGNTNRDGDSAYLCALKVRGMFIAATTAGAYTYRIIVGYSGEEVTTANVDTTFVSGLATSEVFLPNTTTRVTPAGVINPKAFTVLYDEVVDVNSQISAVADVKSVDFTVPLNQSFYYQSSGSVQGKLKNLYVLVNWLLDGLLFSNEANA